MLLATTSATPSFSTPIAPTIALLLAAWLYLRGWSCLGRAFPSLISSWRVAAFVGGLLCVWIAVGSRLGSLDERWLSVHMLQHLLLMIVAPALIWLGAPPLLFLHAVPQGFTRRVVAPFLRLAPARWLGGIISQPWFCWLAATVVLIGWHVPAAYALGVESHVWHEIEHATFFAAGLLFWWPVIAPWPVVPRYSQWSMVVYLFLATLPCDALSAYLAFCDRVVYPCYLAVPRQMSMSALEDQQCAGALMWVFVTFAYLLPAVMLTTSLLWSANAEEHGGVRKTGNTQGSTL